MTSNVGSQRRERTKEAVLEEMRRHFRPEFLNRVDEIIVFQSLTEAQLEQIVEIQLNRLRARLAERRLSIELTAEARSFLVRTGYDPNYGARPLKRAIQKEIETPLARRLLKGELRDGQTVDVDLDAARGELRFTPRD
jgi:ATP-dependent Clp protease ATP-binding subunit ClpB